MSSSGHNTRGLLLVLLAGVCLATRGAYAAQSSTANSPPKPAPHPAANSTHSATTQTVTKKPATPSTASHSVTPAKVTSPSATAHPAATKTTPHASTASAAKTTPARTAAYAPRRKGAPARRRHPRTLTGRQRLARLHLQPDRVQEIQQALIREGYFQGESNGQWDSRTHEAMLHYQTDHGFPPTGLPEAKSLMKLGLGSHPLPAELDHGAVGVASPAAAPGDPAATPPSPPVSQATPPPSVELH